MSTDIGSAAVFYLFTDLCCGVLRCRIDLGWRIPLSPELPVPENCSLVVGISVTYWVTSEISRVNDMFSFALSITSWYLNKIANVLIEWRFWQAISQDVKFTPAKLTPECLLKKSPISPLSTAYCLQLERFLLASPIVLFNNEINLQPVKGDYFKSVTSLTPTLHLLELCCSCLPDVVIWNVFLILILVNLMLC